MRLQSKKIIRFFSELNEVEKKYLQTHAEISGLVQSVILKMELTKEDVMKEFQVTETSYEAFIKGALDYDLGTIATINYLNSVLEERKFKNSQQDKIKIG
jgi:hypothetical protein